jgi:hypothetical protein
MILKPVILPQIDWLVDGYTQKEHLTIFEHNMCIYCPAKNKQKKIDLGQLLSYACMPRAIFVIHYFLRVINFSMVITSDRGHLVKESILGKFKLF